MKPRSIIASTTGPWGISMAIPTACGCAPVASRIQFASSARPAPPCRKARSPRTLPCLSMRQTWCNSEPQSIPTKNSRSSMTFLSISLLNGPPRCLPVPVLALSAQTPHWAMARDRGTGPPQVLKAQGGGGLLSIPWPGSSRMDENRMIAGSPDEQQLPSGFPSALRAPVKPEGSCYRPHSLRTVRGTGGCAVHSLLTDIAFVRSGHDRLGAVDCLGRGRPVPPKASLE